MNPELTTNPSQVPAGTPTHDADPPADAALGGAHPKGTLKQRAKRGAVIFAASQIVGQLMRLGGNLVLTRLLIPEHFGIMALVTIFISGITMFSDLGIRPSIVQNKMGDDQRFLDTAWTLQVIRGFGIFFVACLIAYPIAYLFYDLPILAQLLPVAALSSIIFGFESTKIHTANRHLLLGREVTLMLACNFAGIVAMAVLAYIYRSVWALVLGTLVIAVLKASLSHVVFPGKINRFAWHKESLGELIRFGKWIFMGTVVVFFANNVDRLVLSKLITTEMLGIYNIAFMLASLPAMTFKRFGNTVVFPIVSRQAELERHVIRGKLLRSQRKLALLMAVPVLAIVVCGDWIVELGWDDRYLEAGWMASLLGIGMWVGMLRGTSQPALLALGKPQYSLFGNIGRVVWVGIAAWLSYTLISDPRYQLMVFLIAFGLSELPAYLIVVYGTSREKIALWQQDLWMTGLLVFVVAGLILGRYLLGWGIPFLPTPG